VSEIITINQLSIFLFYNFLLKLMEKPLSQTIRERMKREGKRFWAGDNISDYVSD
jgi:hypothetical protein